MAIISGDVFETQNLDLLAFFYFVKRR